MKLDEEQSRAVDALGAGQATLVLGGPGTGKTSVLRAHAEAVAQAGASAVFLCSGRHAADRLRNQITLDLGHMPPGLSVRTAQAWAFTVLQAWAADRGRHTPELISGPRQDAIIADLVSELGPHLSWPEGLSDEVRNLPGFRAELRDLLTRAAELGLTPAELADLGNECREPMWGLAAQIMASYEDILALEDAVVPGGVGRDRFDHARLVYQAARVISDDSLWQSPEAIPVPDWVIADDCENVTLATFRLLQSAQAAGARLAFAGDPDVAVETFRGGMALAPKLATTELGCDVVTLKRRHRGGTALAAAINSLTGYITASGLVDHRNPEAGDEEDSIEILTFPGNNEEHFHIARTLRLAHLDGMSYDDMAVLTRSRADHGELGRVLRAAGIEVRSPASNAPLRFSPVISGLMAAMDAALTVTRDEHMLSLLSSPFGPSPLERRTLLRQVAAWSLENPGEEPLSRAAESSESWAKPLAALRTAIEAGRTAHEAGGNAEDFLWAIWNATEGKEWQEKALDDAGLSAMLDDVMAAFRVAQRLVDRDSRVNGEGLLEELATQEVAEDTIARSAAQRGVHLLTPSMALGCEFPLLIIAGLQDGVWPNTRIRDGVFGASKLVDHCLGRLVTSGEKDNNDRRQTVIVDELRMLAMSIGRGSKRVILTAVGTDEATPSRFLDVLSVPRTKVSSTPLSMSVAGIVGQLRSILTDHSLGVSEEVRDGAAQILASLAADHVRGASPDDWVELREQSTEEPWVRDVRVSPSAIESILRCPLKWFTERQGLANVDDRFARDLGTFVHDLAENETELQAMIAKLDEAWDGLAADLPEGFERQRAYESAHTIVETLATYLAQAGPGEKEMMVSARHGDATVSGRIDRLESDVIVDFKTGRSVLSGPDAMTNPQMMTYQWLWEQKTRKPSMGAKLVYLAKPLAKGGPTIRTQPGLTDQTRAEVADMIDSVVTDMSSHELEARVNRYCDSCPARVICPLHEGELSS